MLSASPRQSVCHVRCLFLLLFLSLPVSLSLSFRLSRRLFCTPFRSFLCLSASLVRSFNRSLGRSPRTTLPFFVRAETIPLGQFSMHGLARFFAASTPIFRRTIRRSAPGFRRPRDAPGDTRHVRPNRTDTAPSELRPVDRLEATIPRSCFPRDAPEDRKLARGGGYGGETEVRHVTRVIYFYASRTPYDLIKRKV